MEISKEQIEALKQRHQGGIFEGSINFDDDMDNAHTVEFIWRKPLTVDLEAYSKVAQRNVMAANLNMMQSLIVYPEPAEVVAQIREYPGAYGRFVEEAVMPFFGSHAIVSRRKL
jgi:uncharacterized iron-regulated protein